LRATIRGAAHHDEARRIAANVAKLVTASGLAPGKARITATCRRSVKLKAAFVPEAGKNFDDKTLLGLHAFDACRRVRKHWGVAMKLPLREFLYLATAAALPVVSPAAMADTYPSKPVRLIVGFPLDTRPILLHGTGVAEEALKLDHTEGIEVVWTTLAGAQGGSNGQEGQGIEKTEESNQEGKESGEEREGKVEHRGR
jgi:hypothetical protein